MNTYHFIILVLSHFVFRQHRGPGGRRGRGTAGRTGDFLTLQHVNSQEISRERRGRFLSASAGERGHGNLIGRSRGERWPRNHCKKRRQGGNRPPDVPPAAPRDAALGTGGCSEGDRGTRLGRTDTAGTSTARGRDLPAHPPALACPVTPVSPGTPGGSQTPGDPQSKGQRGTFPQPDGDGLRSRRSRNLSCQPLTAPFDRVPGGGERCLLSAQQLIISWLMMYRKQVVAVCRNESRPLHPLPTTGPPTGERGRGTWWG